MKFYVSAKLICAVAIPLLFGALPVYADGSPVQPAHDLGEDVMKPMAGLLKAVVTSLPDGTQNPATLKALSDLSDKIDVAIVTTPDTDAYKKEVGQVGADTALMEYQSMLKSLKATVQSLSSALSAAGPRACGANCDTILGQIKQLESQGHSAFKDPDPPGPGLR